MSIKLTPEKIDELYHIYLNNPSNLTKVQRRDISKWYHELHKDDEIKGV